MDGDSVPFFYDHAVCACNRLFKNKVIFLPVSNLILLFSADGQQQCAGEDACQIEISEIWSSLSPTEGDFVQCDYGHTGKIIICHSARVACMRSLGHHY